MDQLYHMRRESSLGQAARLFGGPKIKALTGICKAEYQVRMLVLNTEGGKLRLRDSSQERVKLLVKSAVITVRGQIEGEHLILVYLNALS